MTGPLLLGLDGIPSDSTFAGLRRALKMRLHSSALCYAPVEGCGDEAFALGGAGAAGEVGQRATRETVGRPLTIYHLETTQKVTA